MTRGSAPRVHRSPAWTSPGGTYQQPTTAQPAPSRPGTASGVPGAARTPDDVAVDRYRYLLRTAPPDAVEQAHAEAFAQLTPEQRRQVLAEVGASVPASERATSDDPRSLARMATRAEMRNPGTLEQTFRGQGGGTGAPGFGAMVGSSLLGTVAGVVIGSAVANALFGPMFGDPTTPVAEDAAAADGGEAGAADAGGDAGADAGAADAGADAGGDEGLFGGMFGGDGGGFFGGDGGGFDGGFDI
ncbi:hypothetical protein UQW22_06450 [Isoptericola halotolerans]|uniref:hypothetical protein n=1 Tax=Isoptericola halotolerans TaxID=300560 RepID=UPI00388D78E3